MKLTELLKQLFETERIAGAGGHKDEESGDIEIRVTRTDTTMFLVQREGGRWSVDGEELPEDVTDDALAAAVRKAAER